MTRISLVEQYNNKDVISQIYGMKEELSNSQELLESATESIQQSEQALSSAVSEIQNLENLATQLGTRTTVVEGYVGSPSDVANPNGTLYARSKSVSNQVATNTNNISTNTNNISSLDSRLTSAESAVSSHTTSINNNATNITGLTNRVSTAESKIGVLENTASNLPSTYQALSQKDALNGYAGLSSAGKIATSQLDTGISLNQILQAGAQLNTGEVLYVGAGGTIRSRIIGEGVEYVGNYANLTALQAYPSPTNGDFGTVYGDSVQSNDGMYMYDGTQWNFVLLFDATDYELVSNLVTGISSASDDAHYPSAKAVYDYCVANDITTLAVSDTVTSGNIAITAVIKNLAGTQIASDTVNITVDTAPTSGSNNPVTSGGVYTALSAKQDTLTFDDSPTSGSNNPVKSSGVYTALSAKQNTLVSGTSIKTVNSTSLLGSGDVAVQPTLTSQTITLASGSWSSNAQTVTGISNVTASNIVWVSPSSASFDEYGSCGIRVTAQGSGSLTFTTNGTDPTNTLTVIVVG